MGTPCTVWSRARHNIKNLRKAQIKEQPSVATALFTCRVARECLKHNVKFSSENPQTSRLWEFAPIADLFCEPGVFYVKFDIYVPVRGSLPKVHGLVDKRRDILEAGSKVSWATSACAVSRTRPSEAGREVFAGAYPAGRAVPGVVQTCCGSLWQTGVEKTK